MTFSTKTDRNSRQLAAWVWSYCWAHHRLFLVAIVSLTIVKSLLPAALALVGRELINALTEIVNRPNTDINTLWFWLILALSATVADLLLTNVIEYCRSRFNDELAISVTTQLMTHLSNQQVAFFEMPSFQDTIELAYKHSAERIAQFVNISLSLASTSVQTFSLLVIIFFIEPLVGLFLLILAVPYLIFNTSLSNRRFAIEKRRTTKRRWLNYYLSFVIHPERIPETKIFGLGDYFIAECKRFLQDFRVENKQLNGRLIFGRIVFGVLISLGLYGLILRILRRVVDGTLSLGDVVLFVGAIGRIRSTIEIAVRNFSSLKEQILYVDNLIKLLTVNSNLPGDLKPALDRLGKIQANRVSFSYPETSKLILDDISFEIEFGETIAIVGENGAGKTTLAKLIARLYDPTAGAIMVDDVNLGLISAEYWYQHLTYIFQNFNQYEATAAENIAFGNWRQLLGDQDAIQKIAAVAGAHDVIANTQNQYATKLGRRFGEANLSTGQWQKIAIARAFARAESKLIILDEPSAHLDAHAEYQLFKDFKELSADRTTILISHRFSTVSMADRIFVLDHGKLVESGTHQALLARGGHYASLYNTQQMQLTF